MSIHYTLSRRSRTAKHIRCAQNVKTVRLCTEFKKRHKQHFSDINATLRHFEDGRH